MDPCLSLRGAHSQTVRAVHWDCQGSNTIVSGAEDAGIALWAPRVRCQTVWAGPVRGAVLVRLLVDAVLAAGCMALASRHCGTCL